MNFKKLENNLLDMIQEQQVKIGYMSGVTRFYYPLQSLNRLLGPELTEEEMREFDGDIEEPKDLDDEPDDGLDTSAFDKTTLCKLDAIFGDKLTVR